MQLVTPPGRKLREPIDLSLRISVLAPRSSFLKRAKPAGVSKRENIVLTRNFPSWTVAGSILVARSKILGENPLTCDIGKVTGGNARIGISRCRKSFVAGRNNSSAGIVCYFEKIGGSSLSAILANENRRFAMNSYSW